MKKVIIFDMDGTLVNSSITIANAINYVRKHLGFEPMNEEKILRLVNDNTINPAQVFYHAKTFDKDHEKWFSEYYSKHHGHELVLYDGIYELLKKLKEKGCKLAIATNAYRVSALESLEHLKIVDFFESVICADDVPQAKPSPLMLYEILEEVKCSKNEAVFIGDGPRDQEAGERANMDYLMVDWGFTEHSNAIQSVDALEKILMEL